VRRGVRKLAKKLAKRRAADVAVKEMMGDCKSGHSIMGILAFLIENRIYGHGALQFLNFTRSSMEYVLSSDYVFAARPFPDKKKSSMNFWEAHDCVQCKCNDSHVKADWSKLALCNPLLLFVHVALCNPVASTATTTAPISLDGPLQLSTGRQRRLTPQRFLRVLSPMVQAIV